MQLRENMVILWEVFLGRTPALDLQLHFKSLGFEGSGQGYQIPLHKGAGRRVLQPGGLCMMHLPVLAQTL